jgi:hypothetical protein
MSSLIERIKKKEQQYVCKYYYDFIKKYCKNNSDENECATIHSLIKNNCNKPKAIT